ncbi:calcium-binding protein [Sphingomonas humi]|uniref:Calcium-binding protein n=1 Tax=Sphingomonas humi TaxID=335630 RepID=A0ABP7RHZ2_9SPHN
MARVILTQPNEHVDVGGDLTVVGSRAGGEVITVIRGTIVLDPSFNAGGDTVRMPDDAAFFTVRLSGASAVIAGLGVSVTIPVGAAGLEVSFNDVSRTLLFESATSKVKLGDQIVTATATAVVPAGGVPTLVGTDGPDIITGTDGSDVIDGLGGADRINGGGGNDVIRGGAGGDDIDGSFGNDQLYGGPGDDRIVDNDGTSAYLDGGTGNDWLGVENYTGTSFTLIGGDGDDYIDVAVGSGGLCVIDAGAGLDRVVIDSNGMPITLTLGSGRDQLVLGEGALASPKFGPVTVTDFQPGAIGDTVEFVAALLVSAINWDAGSNPFTAGYLRILDRDGSAVLQFDRDGPSSTLYGFRDAIIFTGIASAALTRENLEGFDPAGTAASLASSLEWNAQGASVLPHWDVAAFA